jgi:hypothetical protein
MRSKIILAVTLALGTLFAVPALADEAKGGGAKPSFPMPAATFKQHVDARQAHAKTKMEERASKLNKAEADALRAKFNERTAKVNAEVAKVIADGTVTKEEAHQVRAAGGGGKGHCGPGGKEKPKA